MGSMLALVVAVTIVGCQFDDPDLRDNLFRCDDAHPCFAADQSCVAGICQRFAATADGVVCGKDTCALGKQCCVDFINPPRCIEAREQCPGSATFCDGREDCADSTCCDTLGIATCTLGQECTQLCRTNDDCPGERPNCCPFDPYPWSACRLVCANQNLSAHWVHSVSRPPRDLRHRRGITKTASERKGLRTAGARWSVTSASRP